MYDNGINSVLPIESGDYRADTDNEQLYNVVSKYNQLEESTNLIELTPHDLGEILTKVGCSLGVHWITLLPNGLVSVDDELVGFIDTRPDPQDRGNNPAKTGRELQPGPLKTGSDP